MNRQQSLTALKLSYALIPARSINIEKDPKRGRNRDTGLLVLPVAKRVEVVNPSIPAVQFSHWEEFTDEQLLDGAATGDWAIRYKRGNEGIMFLPDGSGRRMSYAEVLWELSYKSGWLHPRAIGIPVTSRVQLPGLDPQDPQRKILEQKFKSGEIKPGDPLWTAYFAKPDPFFTAGETGQWWNLIIDGKWKEVPQVFPASGSSDLQPIHAKLDDIARDISAIKAAQELTD